MKLHPLILILALLLATPHANAQDEMPPELLDRVRAASLDYHQRLRNYDITVKEVLHSKKRQVHQTSTKQIIEDSLGQLRVESHIEQFDPEGNITASADMIHIYDLQKETASQILDRGEGAQQRTVTIRKQNSLATVIQPKTFYTAEGKPFYKLIDNLRTRQIPIYGKILDFPDYPGTLVEFIYLERLPNNDQLRHRYLLNLSGNFFPMRQEIYLNGNRHLVLIPTPKELAPGIFFPIKCTKIAYDDDKDGKEVASVTDISVENIRLNTNIPPKTFTFKFQTGDIITDHRTNPPTQRVYTPAKPPPAPEA